MLQIVSVFVLPAVSLLLTYVFVKIRQRFPYTVNCWFCNQNSKVDYSNINSFNCQHCQQYNGFTDDGDYNKKIPEQYDELLNHSSVSGSILNVSSTSSHNSSTSNGLCKFCNNNQQLKVYQLANYVPMNPDNYDMEIEHFKKQLEKAYKLCKKCDHVLKEKILFQNKWLLGLNISSNRSNMFDKSLDANMSCTNPMLLFLLKLHMSYFCIITVLGLIAAYSGLNVNEDTNFICVFFVTYGDLIAKYGGCLSIFTGVACAILSKRKIIKQQSKKLTTPQKSFHHYRSSPPSFDNSSLKSYALSESLLSRQSSSPLNLQNISNSSSDFGIRNLKLSASPIKPVISPPKFHRNPWTNQQWDLPATNVSSRSSSQSSGFVSAPVFEAQDGTDFDCRSLHSLGSLYSANDYNFRQRNQSFERCSVFSGFR